MKGGGGGRKRKKRSGRKEKTESSQGLQGKIQRALVSIAYLSLSIP